MMAKAIWTGILHFGLVGLPVRLYTATQSPRPRAHEVQRETGARIRHQRVTEAGERVPYSEVAKGFDVGPGQTVTIERHELEQLAPPRSKSIDIAGFVPLDRIDPLYFAERAYFLSPADHEYDRVYGLLRGALARSGMAGIAQFTMRGHRYLGAVRALPELIVLHTLRRADEVRDPQSVAHPPRSETREPELALTEQLLDLLVMDWEPRQYSSDYDRALRKLVEAKASPEKALTPAEEIGEGDLVSTLLASIATAKAGRQRPAE